MSDIFNDSNKSINCLAGNTASVLEEIDNKLHETMISAFNTIYNTAESRHVDMRLAAYMVGVRKMAEASRFRGWV